jgi:hypothetical protein
VLRFEVPDLTEQAHSDVVTLHTGGGMDTWRATAIADLRSTFSLQHSLAERAIAQLDNDQLFRTAGDEDNSIAVLMKHVGGNLRSRWTEPFTTDGEKPDRNRDSEFVADTDDAASVRAVWERGWSVLAATLDALQPADLERTITIRGEPSTAMNALLRSLAHTAQHVGQIILLAKQWSGEDWQTLSIPRPPRP